MRSSVLSCVCVLCLTTACAAQTGPAWTELSLSTCQVDAYRKAHPSVDGRGIVIAVLDTGVDMGVAGLLKTTTGDVKVVDVQDFSTQGDVDLSRATWNEAKDKIVHYLKDGSPELFAPPPAEMRPDGTTVWFGILKEEAFKNSSVPDLNDNGNHDDVFGICVISRDDGTDDDAVCYVDTDADRDFTDERPLKNYKLNHDAFTFAREKKEKEAVLLSCALNVFVRQRKVVLHFDDGGHGTHVAGIATGHRIMNQDGFDGVAPGAKVISLKIGENSLAGGASTTGAMKKAFQYAARYAREHDVTVVCNLSYGLTSKHERHSDFDCMIEKLLRANPNLIICTSAGNEGPGLSSIGTPAAADSVISVGALLASDTARDYAGVQIPHAQLAGFSSRGGDVDKPDVVTPGLMTSTVPRWVRGGDFWGGTSMASPYAAGLCALLAQCVQEEAGVAPRADWIKTALKNTAEPVPGYTTLDYGAGQPNMVKAAEMVVTLAKKYRDDPLYSFDVSTESPLAVDASGPAAYWRSTYFPTDRPQVFTIKPVFVPQVDAAAITAFSRRLILRSDADWCKLLQDQIYFRGEQSARVRVEYDAEKLKEPGLYVATVEGLDGDVVALRLVNTIVVPHEASPRDGYCVKLDDQTVEGWEVRRHFFAVPAGAGAMHITLHAINDQPSTALVGGIHRPDGRSAGHGYPLRLDTKNDRLEGSSTVREELEPGVWELPIRSAKADETSAYSLEVRFDGIQAEPEVITDLSSSPGSMPSGSVTLTNVFNQRTTVTTSGRIEGYRKTVTKKLTPDDDTATISLAFTPDIEAVRVRVEVSDEDYVKFTDAAVSVYDGSGKAIAKDGLEGPVLTMTTANPDPAVDSTTCSLEIRPAFTEPNIEDSAEFDIQIDYLYEDPIDIEVERGGSSELALYPGIPAELSFTLGRTPPEAPEETSTIGYIRAIERVSKKPVVEIEICENRK
ncbi:MAG: S8 family serine peptidase [Phycisphaerae bacterium]|nr:S8 family serine peptidase [Phycisphaerae bacterium]